MSSDNEEHFKVLRKVGEQDAVSQRKLSKDLGMSLGKINYCLKALKTKGLIKIKNFKNNKKKNWVSLSFNAERNKRKNKNYD